MSRNRRGFLRRHPVRAAGLLPVAALVAFAVGPAGGSSAAGPEGTPSIVHAGITTVREGQTLRYSELTGREKRDYLFDHGIRPTAYADSDLPDAVLGIVRFSKSALDSLENHRLRTSLTRVGDELEEPKYKLFHTFGSTAKIVFTPEPGTPYSGLLAETVPGLARFSYAGPVSGVGVVPGLGIKLFVDGDHPSENLVAMTMLDSQRPLWRFFSHSHSSVFQNPVTNILPDPRKSNLVMREVQQRFETVVEKGEGLHQLLDNFARVHTDGSLVPEGEVSAPYRLILRPAPEAVAASDPGIDFRRDLARNLRAGTVIYQVYALDEPREKELRQSGVTRLEDLLGAARRIGTIATESEFVASRYGDYRLYFKHSDRFLRDSGTDS